MCGRFGSSFTADELTDRFQLSIKPIGVYKSYNIAPSSTIPAIIQKSPNKAVLMHWQYVAPWSKDPSKEKLKPINAKSEGIETSGFYRSAFKHNRTCIPFSHFYEWKKYEKGGEELKQPMLIKVKSQKISSFAGIYSEFKDAEGKSQYYTCILTTRPNKLMSEIHHRMPVVLREEDEDNWMKEDTPLEELKRMMEPYDSEDMEAYPISTLVNSPKNDTPEIIKRIEVI